ncbi:MAG: TolC family protein, partial [Proteobacteria bacterium]|nr:TolC family protein [Pseudomonadota bacterium]
MWTDIFVRRPVMAIVLSLVIVVLGFISYGRLGVQETPDIERPIVSVRTTYFGADPAIMESEVTEVIERELNGVEGLETLTSTSQTQSSRISLEFQLNRDLETAANDVRDKVARARRDLPVDVEEPVVEKADSEARPVMYLRLSGERSLQELSELADILVRERFETVDGVSGVDIFGERRYAIRVDLDAARMALAEVVVSDIQQALNEGNLDAPAGRVEGWTTDASIRLDGGLHSVEEFEKLVVVVRDGNPVRLGDLGRVRIGAEDERTSARSDGEPSVTVAVRPQAKANIIAIADELRRRIPDVQRNLPADVELYLSYDRSLSVRASIADVRFTLLVSATVVVLVIFCFLRSFRATVVPAAAIGVSLVGTFTFMNFVGFTINVFTLFGLVLAIGIVVDDAIVVLENIWRRMQDGEAPLDAALRGTRQIVFPVIATTLSLVAVFTPIIFMGGQTGRLFLEFGGTVAVAVVISTVVALTLSPTLCALLLSFKGTSQPQSSWWQRIFDSTLRFAIRHPCLSVLAIVFSLMAGGLGLWLAPRDFFPTEDRGFFIVRMSGPEGVGFEWMDARVRELEPEVMAAVPERTSVFTRVASGRGGSPGSSNSGFMGIVLKPKDQRERTQSEIAAALWGVVGDVTAFRAIPIELPTVGRGFGAPFQFVLQHGDYDTLIAHLPHFLELLEKEPGFAGVDANLKLDRLEIQALLDREKASQLGIPLREVARTLQVLTTGLELSQFKRGTRQYPVIVGLQRSDRLNPADLGRLSVRTATNEMVRLDNVVTFVEGSSASARYHFNRAPSATISASLQGISLGEAIQRAREIVRTELPNDFRTALAGQSKEFGESSEALRFAFILAFVMVYLVLAAQFDSFIDPIPILVSLPVAVAGAIAALALTGEPLSFFAQVGLILLVGLVTKNGILIVEFANQLREQQGLEAWEAAHEAAKIRLRPIVMTAFSTVGAALPIALGMSGNGRTALGVVVVFGMAISTVLTLYVTPVIWASLQRFRPSRPAGSLAKAVVVSVAIGLFSGNTAQATPTTLSEALQTALDDNATLAATRASQDEMRATIGIARSNLLPDLSATGRAHYGNTFVAGGGVGGEPNPYASAFANVDVPLLDLPAWAELASSNRNFEAATATTAAVEQIVLAGVANAWVALWQAQAELKIRSEQAERSATLTEYATHRSEVGAAEPIDATRAAVQLQRDRLATIDAVAALAKARADLEAWIGRSSHVLEAAGIGELPEPTSGMPEISSLPEVTAARAREVAAGADRRAAAHAWLPTLSAYGQGGAQSRFDENGWIPSTA